MASSRLACQGLSCVGTSQLAVRLRILQTLSLVVRSPLIYVLGPAFDTRSELHSKSKCLDIAEISSPDLRQTLPGLVNMTGRQLVQFES